MTSMNPTAEVAIGHRPSETSPTQLRRVALPLAAVALAASLAGGIVGGAVTAAAAPTIFVDRAAEKTRLLDFAEQLKYALRWDDLHRQMYPYVR